MVDEFTHTKAGLQNINNLCEKFDCDMITFRINPKVFRDDAKKELEEKLNPLEYFERRLYKTPFEISKMYGIKLVFYGECAEFEYGSSETLNVFHSLTDEDKN